MQEGPKRKPASYSFAQQTDSSCHIMPFINLSILNNMRTQVLEHQENELDIAAQQNLYSRRSWLPQTFLWTKTWQQAMAKLVEGPFGDYQREMLEKGVVNGHMYDQDGTNYIETINPVENYARMLLVPFNFTDAQSLPEDLGYQHAASAFKTLPLFWDQGKAICYDPEKGDYDHLTEVKQQNDIDKGEWDIAIPIIQGTTLADVPSHSEDDLAPGKRQVDLETEALSYPGSLFYTATQKLAYNLEEMYESGAEIVSQVSKKVYGQDKYKHVSTQFDHQFFPTSSAYRYFKLSPMQKEFLDLPAHKVLYQTSYSSLGYEMGFKHRYLPEQAETNSYYMSSLLQLMLFAMGVDKDNNAIEIDHPLYEAHKALKTEMGSSQTNPWGLPSFNKENCLEYHIANMIKKDPSLKEKMEKTVNLFFPAWKYYKDMDNCYDSADPNTRRSMTERKQWLMGEEQFLAYCFVMNARFLWAASISREAFNAVLEVDPILANLMKLPFVPGPNQLMRNAQQKTMNGYSYLDVWQEIQESMIVNKDVPKELVSFSGHGIVMSFHHDLIKQQMQQGVESPKVMKALNFAVIDSYYGEQLNPMYRNKSGTQAKDVCNLSTLTAEPTRQKVLKFTR